MQPNVFTLSQRNSVVVIAFVGLLLVFVSTLHPFSLLKPPEEATAPQPSEQETRQKVLLGAASSSNFTNYTNPQHGFSLLYPSNWVNEEIPPGTNLTYLISFNPPASEIGEFVFVYVAVKNLTNNNTSLRQFADQEIGLLKRPPAVTSPAEDTSARTILESGPATVAGNTSAHKVVYTEKISGTLSKIMEVCILLLSINNNDIALINTKAESSASPYNPISDSTTFDTPAIPASKIKFSVFNEPDLGIKFLYPLEWEPVTKRGSDNSTIIEILFPNMTSENASGGLGSGHWHGPTTSFIILSIVDISSELSSYNTTSALNLLTKQNLALANRTLSNFELISSNETIFAETPAYKVVYSFTEPSIVTPSDFQFQSMNVWAIKGDKQYTISYSQPIEEYPTYLGIVQQIVESFKITM